MKYWLLFLIVYLILPSAIINAQVPQKISYQGSLLTGAGVPVADGDYKLQFDIYATATGGTLLWSETHLAIPVERGSYSLILGSIVPLAMPADANWYYLEVTVHSGPSIVAPLTFSPRSEITSSLYTERSTYADTAKVVMSGGIELPYFGIVETPSPAFSIKNTGTGTAGQFTINNESNASVAVDVSTSGEGDGVHSVSYDGWGVYGKSSKLNNEGYLGGTHGVFGSSSLNGSAGRFEITNPSNSSSSIYTSTNGEGHALYAFNTGTGNAGRFEVTNPTNSFSAVFANTNGTGKAGFFSIANPLNPSHTIYSSTNGFGGAGNFVSTNPDAILPTVYIEGHAISNGYLWEDRRPTLSVENFGSNCAGYFKNSSRSWGALEAYNENDTGWAVISRGKILTWGLFSWRHIFARDKRFRIDHPLDPNNMLLNHSCIESNEMKNLYDGVVTCDASGQAIVTLPTWFEALNMEFRYQLTCIGEYSPVYILDTIKTNTFKIGGGKDGLKVSWLVTGVRHDTYAIENPLVVEEPKSQEYLELEARFKKELKK